MVVNDADEFDKVVSVTWLPPSGEWSIDQLKARVPLSLSAVPSHPVRPELGDKAHWRADDCVRFAICRGSRFPLALPFSQTYPLCCVDIRSFTEQYYQFAEGFAEHHRDIDDVLRKVCFLVVFFLESFFFERGS